MLDINSLQEKLKISDSSKIFFTDLNGRIRGLSINPDNIGKIIEKGIGFDGSSIDGLTTVDDSDRLLTPVADSLKILDFDDKKLGFFIGQIFDEDGTPSKSDPRSLLQNIIQQAGEEYGFHFLLGPEYEFFLLKGEENDVAEHTDMAGYFHSDPFDKGETVREEIINAITNCGIKFEKDHHEVTPSQHEINFECLSPLEAADQTILFKHVAKKIAAKYGFYTTFMPKPFNGYNRSAFHMHLSMFDSEGKNLFYSDKDENNLSDLAKYFIGGIVKYARETSIIMASTYNSYKAYTKEKEAPISRGWGIRNRSSMIRVPIATDSQSTRIELRSPDPAGNTYLQIAVFIAMGLYGIKNKIDSGSPDSGNVYKKLKSYKVWDDKFLPKCMFEALVEAERSKFLKNILGDEIYENYMKLKTSEWESYRTHVTLKEHKKIY